MRPTTSDDVLGSDPSVLVIIIVVASVFAVLVFVVVCGVCFVCRPSHSSSNEALSSDWATPPELPLNQLEVFQTSMEVWVSTSEKLSMFERMGQVTGEFN
jgi:hypothetical protein